MDTLSLQSLLYDITIPTADRNTLNDYTQKLHDFVHNSDREIIYASCKPTHSLLYIPAHDVFIKGNYLQSFSRSFPTPTSVSTLIATKFTKPGYIILIGSDTVGLRDITSWDEINIIHLFLNSMPSKIVNEIIFSKKILFFENQTEFLEHIMQITSKSLQEKSAVIANSLSVSLAGKYISFLEKTFMAAGWAVMKTTSKVFPMNQILFVAEKSNIRISFMVLSSNYRNFQLHIHTPTSPLYNYIDVGRTFILPDRDLNLPVHDLNIKISTSERNSLEDYYQKFDSNLSILTNEMIEKTLLHIKKQVEFEQAKETTSNTLLKKIQIKVNDLDITKTPFKLNDVEYFPKGMVYSNQRIEFISAPIGSSYPHNSDEFGYYTIDKMLKTVNSYNKRLFVAEYNFIPTYSLNSPLDISFDVAYDLFMGTIMRIAFSYSHPEGDTIIQVGSVTVNYTKVFSTNVKAIRTTQHYINGFRISLDDLPYVTHQAISYNTQEEYDNFVKEVSYTSLKIHEIVKGGLVYNILDDLYGGTLNLSLKVTREKNRNYIIIDGKKKKIKNINKVLSSRNKRLVNIVETLVDPTVIEGLTFDELRGFINKSKETYLLEKQKNEEILNETLKMLNVAIIDNKNFYNGVLLNKCYELTTATRKYFIDSKPPFKIYSGEEGKYICMLDKTPFVSDEVKLVSRLYALHNDSLISTQISTLNF